MSIPPDTPMTPTEIRTLRKAHGLSAADLAHFLGVGERTLRRWEAGGSPIPTGVAEQVHTINETIDTIAEDFRAAMQTAMECGMWSVEVPMPQDSPPDWVRTDASPGLWKAGAARAVEQLGVRLTSVRDLP